MFKFPFMPREEKFFGLFQESAHNIVKTAQSLKDLIDTWEDVEAKVAEIEELEHRGDTITHQIMAQLHRTFVTPFDREDIAQLAHTMDDVTDFIQSAADHMLLYKVNHPGETAKELANIIVQSTNEVEKAVLQLQHRIELKQILQHCVEINRLENMADKVFRSAVAELFENTANMCQVADICEVIKWREIYEYMETATDRCEDVADVIEGVALKHA